MDGMTVESAAEFARKAHGRQKDKVGMPYFETHVQDVHRRVVAAGGDEDEQVAALLHDVLEDTTACEADLRSAGISEAALRLVRLMTKLEDADSMPYLEHIRAWEPARQLKLADIASNTDPVRLDRLDPAQRRKSLTKYIGYLEALGADAEHLRVALQDSMADETREQRQERLDRVLDDRMACALHQVLVDEDDFTQHQVVRRESPPASAPA